MPTFADVAQALRELSDASLILRGTVDTPWFTCHRFIRDFAASRLSNNKLTEYWERLAQYYVDKLGLATDPEAIFDDDERREFIDDEYDNLIGAVDWLSRSAARNQSHDEMLASFCIALRDYWNIRAEWETARRYTQHALNGACDSATKAELMLGDCQTRADMTVDKKAESAQIVELVADFKQAIRLIREVGNASKRARRIEAFLLHEYGRCLDNLVYDTSRSVASQRVLSGGCQKLWRAKARDLFQESLDLWSQLGDERQIARLTQALGFRAMVNGDYENAIAKQCDAFNRVKRLGYRELEGRCLHQIGRVWSAIVKGRAAGGEEDVNEAALFEVLVQCSPELKHLLHDDLLESSLLFVARAISIADEVGALRAKVRSMREMATVLSLQASQTSPLKAADLTEKAIKCLEDAMQVTDSLGKVEGRDKLQDLLDKLRGKREALNP